MPKKIRGKRENKANTPARSAKQVTRRRRREQDTRWQGSMEDVRVHQEQIEARLREQQADGPAVGAQYADLTREVLQGQHIIVSVTDEAADLSTPESLPTFPEQDLILSDDGRVIFRPKPPPPAFVFSAALKKKYLKQGGSDNVQVCGNARRMMHKGYRIDNVLAKTGADFYFLEDLPIGRDGYIPESKRDD